MSELEREVTGIVHTLLNGRVRGLPELVSVHCGGGLARVRPSLTAAGGDNGLDRAWLYDVCNQSRRVHMEPYKERGSSLLGCHRVNFKKMVLNTG